MPAASATVSPPRAGDAAQRIDVDLLLTALPTPTAGGWAGSGSAAPQPLFRQVPVELQRRRSDNWLAWNIGRVRPDPFAVLFERYWQPISAFCITIVGTREEAEDAAQETMWRAYATLSRREERPEFRPWIHAIARNASLDRLRQRNRGPQLGFDGEELEVPAFDGPDEVLGRRERLERLIGDLQALSERQRAAIVLREISGLSHDEIADTLGTTPARTKSLVSEARQALAERRAGYSLSCGDYRDAVTAAGGRAPRAHRLSAHRETCPDCRTYSRPRILSGLVFPPLFDLFSRAGRRIGELAGPAFSNAGPAGGAKLAAAASVAALSLPAAHLATRDDPPAPVHERTPATAPLGERALPPVRSAPRPAGPAEKAARHAAAPTPAADVEPRRADHEVVVPRVAEPPAATDTILPSANDRVAALSEPLADEVRRVERLLNEDVPSLIETTRRALLPGVEIGPGGVRLDVPRLIPDAAVGGSATR